MPRGGARPGAGRKPGSKGKLTAAMAEAVSAVSDASSIIGRGPLPLDVMLKVMRNSKNSIELRLEAAKAAAPYIHPKMPQAVVVGGETQVERVTVEIVGAPIGS